MDKNLSDNAKYEGLDWVTIRDVAIKEVADGHFQETGKQKLFRKVSENPFVPLGALLTVCALGYGLFNFSKGNSQMSQYMMRARVAAQAFTFIAITTGFILAQRKLEAKKSK
ncbi:hypothetical protein M0802_000439 [Mischocyttarus mexicanus]|nr:hypothetical protein M0802_000439 [Mischocyttarus mexicanus]